MIYLSWNCRDIGQDSTVDAMREQIHKQKPSIVFLSKTKVKGNGIEVIQRSLGFQHGFFMGSNGLSRGLYLWWKHHLAVQILFSFINTIDTCVQDPSPGEAMQLS